jgi:NDP-sugar pyrophosphorylase family protein
VDIADVPVAILAGGLATRLRPVTQTVPKALVPVAGRPFIDHQLDLLHRHGIRHVVLCLGYLGEQVEQRVGTGRVYGLDVQYSFDGPKLLGTGGALRQAAALSGDVFWVLYGDSYLDFDYAAALSHFASHPAASGLMTVFANHGRFDQSNVVFRDGRLLRYDKRAKTPEMTHIDYGASLLRRAALSQLPADGPCDLADLYSGLVARGQMVGYEVSERFYEIGSPEGLREAETRLAADARAA